MTTRIEASPLPSQFGSDEDKAMFQSLSAEMPFPIRFIATNIWLFSPLLSWFMSRNPHTDCTIRTTTAVTMFNGGIKCLLQSPTLSVADPGIQN
ncbi:N-fatty-acyl-amino acid synthase/hydrolase PM20D1.2-like [Anneissia japonica]|uniref:N-fatty-acyl-amino acid synthase/hydrolase PM20D1.2-like n=1 Tax=Anneissia japonica TaxID=1529436 RepID=UPI0014257152|nr:N-fatty-acyl-amino acid synthase/hydrolase PM20D1.2-like [Anneissia japonica]